MSKGQGLLLSIFLQGQAVACTAFSKNNIHTFMHEAKKTTNIMFSKVLNKRYYPENINIEIAQTSFIIKNS